MNNDDLLEARKVQHYVSGALSILAQHGLIALIDMEGPTLNLTVDSAVASFCEQAAKEDMREDTFGDVLRDTIMSALDPEKKRIGVDPILRTRLELLPRHFG